jgi:hypothetical protein
MGASGRLGTSARKANAAEGGLSIAAKAEPGGTNTLVPPVAGGRTPGTGVVIGMTATVGRVAPSENEGVGQAPSTGKTSRRLDRLGWRRCAWTSLAGTESRTKGVDSLSVAWQMRTGAAGGDAVGVKALTGMAGVAVGLGPRVAVAVAVGTVAVGKGPSPNLVGVVVWVEVGVAVGTLLGVGVEVKSRRT